MGTPAKLLILNGVLWGHARGHPETGQFGPLRAVVPQISEASGHVGSALQTAPPEPFSTNAALCMHVGLEPIVCIGA